MTLEDARFYAREAGELLGRIDGATAAFQGFDMVADRSPEEVCREVGWPLACADEVFAGWRAACEESFAKYRDLKPLKLADVVRATLESMARDGMGDLDNGGA